jgi:hypothetical protein
MYGSSSCTTSSLLATWASCSEYTVRALPLGLPGASTLTENTTDAIPEGRPNGMGQKHSRACPGPTYRLLLKSEDTIET